MRRKASVAWYLILSLVGAILLVTASILSIPVKAKVTYLDIIFVGLLFILSCIIGISLALKPNWLKGGSSKHASSLESNNMDEKTNRTRRGHHPICHNYQNHTISHKGKIFCAACLGLAIGSSLSILLMVLYLVIFPYLSLTEFILFLFIGLMIIVYSYIETVIPQRTGVSHVASNVLLVIGFFFVVAGVFGTTKSLLIGAFAVILSFLWLDTRVQLSHWNHEKICRNCRKSCKAY